MHISVYPVHEGYTMKKELSMKADFYYLLYENTAFCAPQVSFANISPLGDICLQLLLCMGLDDCPRQGINISFFH